MSNILAFQAALECHQETLRPKPLMLFSRRRLLDWSTKCLPRPWLSHPWQALLGQRPELGRERSLSICQVGLPVAFFLSSLLEVSWFWWWFIDTQEARKDPPSAWDLFPKACHMLWTYSMTKRTRSRRLTPTSRMVPTLYHLLCRHLTHTSVRIDCQWLMETQK